MYHYKKLDATIRANPYDTSAACAYSVVYMEKLTRLAAHPDGNYFGWRSSSRQDLISWKENIRMSSIVISKQKVVPGDGFK